MSEESGVSGPLWLLAELTYRCPLQCPYCSNPSNYEESLSHELTTEEWISALRQARAMGAVQLGLSGGEPCLRTDLEEIVAEAHKLGFYTNLITSAYNLSSERISNLKEAGLDHIQVSIQGADKRTNDLLAGTACFDRKIAALYHIKEQGYPLVFNFVVHRFNIHQVWDLLTLANMVEADFVEVANCQYHGFAFLNKEALLPTPLQIRQAEEEVARFRSQLSRKMEIFFVVPDYFEEHISPCVNGWGTTMVNVSPNGRVLPCHGAGEMKHLPIPNIREQSLQDIWYHSTLFNQYRGTSWMKEPCASCPEKEKDFGGCRCQALAWTQDAANTDPCCPKSPHHGLIEKLVDPASQRQPLVQLRNTRGTKMEFGELVFRGAAKAT